MDSSLLVHALGMVGFVLILGAYWLVSAGRTPPASPQYQWLNLGGAIVLILYSGFLGAWVSVALNVVWAAIAANALRGLAGR
jgi:hypothetical protein